MSERIFYVYEHWRPDKDVCFYVGKGKGRRAYAMNRARSKYHQNIQKKLTRLGMCVEVRMVGFGLSERDAYALEIERIAFWRGIGIRLANLADGGGGPSGYRWTPEQRAKKKAGWRPFSEEALARIGAASKGRKPRLGMSVSEETREKLRKNGFDRIDLFLQYQHLGPKAFSRPVVCLDDNLEFESASAAARHYGVSKSALIELCLGKKYRQTVGGHVFKYRDAK